MTPETSSAWQSTNIPVFCSSLLNPSPWALSTKRCTVWGRWPKTNFVRLHKAGLSTPSMVLRAVSAQSALLQVNVNSAWLRKAVAVGSSFMQLQVLVFSSVLNSTALGLPIRQRQILGTGFGLCPVLAYVAAFSSRFTVELAADCWSRPGCSVLQSGLVAFYVRLLLAWSLVQHRSQQLAWQVVSKSTVTQRQECSSASCLLCLAAAGLR